MCLTALEAKRKELRMNTKTAEEFQEKIAAELLALTSTAEGSKEVGTNEKVSTGRTTN